MSKLLLHGSQVLFLAIKLYPIGVPKGVGGFSFFIEAQGFQIFFDELLNGLAGPFPSLPYKEGIIIVRSFPVALLKGQELLQVLFQGFVNDDMAGDASLAVVNENLAFAISNLQVSAF